MNQTITNPQGENLDYSFHASNNESSDLLIIGHGVTGNKDRPFVVALAEAVSTAGINVLRFLLPVMEIRMEIFAIVRFPRRSRISDL